MAFFVSGFNCIQLHSVDSTNNYAARDEMQPKLPHKSVIMADVQTHGKGQFQNHWESESGKNLLCSIVLRPEAFSVDHQSSLNHISALALFDTILHFVKARLHIKWPNDIWLKKQKIAGLLVENNVIGKRISRSIIGIGLNINQLHFETGDFQSIKKYTGNSVLPLTALEYLLYRFNCYYDGLGTHRESYHRLFDQNLWGYGQINPMIDAKGNSIHVKILGTTTDGSLKTMLPEKVVKTYRHKEIRFN